MARCLLSRSCGLDRLVLFAEEGGHDEAAQINWSRVGKMMGGWQLPVRCHLYAVCECFEALTSMIHPPCGCGVLPASTSI
uniref:Uncharacterized protein n=1 Tax=Leersia perrieri TaxID=77586 RepID=A0A0D9VK71_9ORYZ